MLVFPNSKINLGLQVLFKRPDGFHEIKTVFYPVAWQDMLEIIENEAGGPPFLISFGGIPIPGHQSDNLIYKAWQLISEKYTLPPIKVFLFKNVPMGAGIGGGSSDAAHFIQATDRKFNLNMSDETKTNMASRLGSDCAFFLANQPLLATGKGDQFSQVKVELSAYFILIVYPPVHSDTKSAYMDLSPAMPLTDLRETIEKHDIASWKDLLVNDFEASLFKKYPQIQALKEKLYNNGAIYASLSGSGSAVYGLFEKEPVLSFDPGYRSFLQKPSTKIL